MIDGDGDDVQTLIDQAWRMRERVEAVCAYAYRIQREAGLASAQAVAAVALAIGNERAAAEFGVTTSAITTARRRARTAS